MTGKLIVIAVLVLMVMLFIFLFHDSGFPEFLKQKKGMLQKRFHEKRSERSVEITNEPILMFHENGKKQYRQSVKMTKSVFHIGRGKKNDLAFSSKKIEERHAVIYKRLKNRQVYYELVNYAKCNPVEHFNKQTGKYEYLGYKDGIRLDSREIFFIGDYKVIISIPLLMHEASETELIAVYNEPCEEYPGRTKNFVLKNENDQLTV